MATIQTLPGEMVIASLFFLPPPDLYACAQVNSKFKANCDRLWIPYARNTIARFGFDGRELQVPNYKQFMHQLTSQHVKSDDEFLSAFQAFLNRVSLGENGRFICLITSGQNRDMISVNIKADNKYSVHDHLPEVHIRETYLASQAVNLNIAFETPNNAVSDQVYAFRHELENKESYHSISYQTPDRHFRANLRFPSAIIPYHQVTPLENRIQEAIQRKLAELYAQEKKSVHHRLFIIAPLMAIGILVTLGFFFGPILIYI